MILKGFHLFLLCVFCAFNTEQDKKYSKPNKPRIFPVFSPCLCKKKYFFLRRQGSPGYPSKTLQLLIVLCVALAKHNSISNKRLFGSACVRPHTG